MLLPFCGQFLENLGQLLSIGIFKIIDADLLFFPGEFFLSSKCISLLILVVSTSLARTIIVLVRSSATNLIAEAEVCALDLVFSFENRIQNFYKFCAISIFQRNHREFLSHTGYINCFQNSKQPFYV